MNSKTPMHQFPQELEEYLMEEDPTEAQDLKNIWAMLEDAKPQTSSRSQVDDALARLRSAMPSPETPAKVTPAPDRQPTVRLRRVPLARTLAIAATVVLLAISFMYWPQSITAPMGETLSVRLSDGSLVELNSGSTLAHSRAFRKLPFAKPIELNGEAFFDVEKGEMPFQINTFNAQVQVLGTSFNVRAWNEYEHSKTSVAVESGRVQVTSLTTDESVLLGVGESAQVNGSDIATNSFQVKTSDTWREGGLFLPNESFASVINEMSRRFNTRIVLAPEIDLLSEVTINYTKVDSIESLLGDLCYEFGLKYRALSDGFELFVMEEVEQ